MCLHVGNWKKLYHKAFSWKVMMYVFLTVTLIMLGGIITFLVVTANQDDNVIVVKYPPSFIVYRFGFM